MTAKQGLLAYITEFQHLGDGVRYLLHSRCCIIGSEDKVKRVRLDNRTDDDYIIGQQRIAQVVTDNQGNQQEYYFTFDGHGSTRVLTDFVGAAVQLYSFDAYGNALGFDPKEALTEFLYSGEQFDAKIGQQYLRARYYDPATGRFNRLDPFFGNLDDPLSLHSRVRKKAFVHKNQGTSYVLRCYHLQCFYSKRNGFPKTLAFSIR